VGDWFIITLVTHGSGVSSSGWAEVSTTSASIRWIRPGYMYPDESSRVLVYWLESHNLLGWCMHIGLWKYIWLHDKIFLALAYPYFWLPCMLFFYPCDDHQFIDGSRCERYSRSTGKRWFRSNSLPGLNFMFYLGFSLGLGNVYCFTPKALFRISAISYSFWVVGFVVSFSISF